MPSHRRSSSSSRSRSSGLPPSSQGFWSTRVSISATVQTMPEIGFGDNVRVHRTPETEALGVAGHVGQVYGHTTPSITGIRVVGGSDGDYALNVHFDGSEDTIWFAPQLLD